MQAKLAQEGYVTVEDLGDRWNTPEDARAQGPRDLEFQDGENNFNQASSRFTAMRLLQAVRAAKSMAQTQLHVGRTAAVERPGTAKGPLLDSLCDRRVAWRPPVLRHTTASNHDWSARAVMPT